jgi:hypothetical protein
MQTNIDNTSEITRLRAELRTLQTLHDAEMTLRKGKYDVLNKLTKKISKQHAELSVLMVVHHLHQQCLQTNANLTFLKRNDTKIRFTSAAQKAAFILSLHKYMASPPRGAAQMMRHVDAVMLELASVWKLEQV